MVLGNNTICFSLLPFPWEDTPSDSRGTKVVEKSIVVLMSYITNKEEEKESELCLVVTPTRVINYRSVRSNYE